MDHLFFKVTEDFSTATMKQNTLDYAERKTVKVEFCSHQDHLTGMRIRCTHFQTSKK